MLSLDFPENHIWLGTFFHTYFYVSALFEAFDKYPGHSQNVKLGIYSALPFFLRKWFSKGTGGCENQQPC